MEIKKRLVIFGLIFIILFTGIFSVNAYMHSSTDFLIKVGTDVGTLQHAINGNYFIGTNTYSSPSALNPGHTANEIWVSVKDGEMNLIQALSSTNKLRPASPLKTSYSGPSDKSKAYHYANEIEISSGKSFQQAIDDGEFYCVPDCSCAATTCVGTTCTDPICGQPCSGTKLPDTCASLSYECGTWSNGCGGTLNCGTCSVGTCSSGVCIGECTLGQTKTKDCDYLDTICRNYNDVTDTCSTSGYWTGDCDSYTDTAKGTDCVIGDTKTCDGSGNCIGWPEPPPGLGCSQCPFGVTVVSLTTGFYRYCKLNENQGKWSWSSTSGWSDWSYIGHYRTYHVPCRHTERYCKLRIIFCITHGNRRTDVYWEIKP